MTESEARRILLVRAFEAPLASPWTEADREWAGREALLQLGSQATPERLIATRATLATRRLEERDPAVAAALDAATPRTVYGAVLLLAAFAAGVTLDALGARGRIEILSPPLLALLAWNLGLYLWLLARAARPAAKRAGPRPARVPALLARWRDRDAAGRPPPLARFAADWTQRSTALRATRVVALLHAGAALLALGALASLYLRGLVFEFRAGWDSTFLDAGDVRAIAAALYGPASLASGIAVPDADAIAGLRLSSGGGENAARWIHLQALTIAGAIILPRAILAVQAHARASGLARRFPLPLGEAYFRRLLPRPTAGLAVCVLPYSYTLAETRLGALQAAVEQRLAAPAALDVADSLAAGSEDDLDALLPPSLAEAQAVVALFALTATPERETHGAFLRGLASRLAGGPALQVMIDEADFRSRFGADGGARLAPRRAAWRHLLADIGLEPQFVDLTPARATP